MKIIIVGDGKVGNALAEDLSQEGHDITIIDNNNDVLQKSVESLDVITIKGNGASYRVQEEADVADADLLIAATSTDELNMICCLVAKRLGARHTIARIRNPEYNEQLRMMKEEMGLSMIVNPEQATAVEIMRLVTFPSAINIGTFAKGRVSVVEHKIQPDNPMAGKTIAKMIGNEASNILICAVNRNGTIYIPKGDFVIQPGDHIHIAGTNKCISAFLRSFGHREKKAKSVMLVGGGLITFYLAKMLMDHGINVTIIEKNPARCEHLCEQLPQTLVICGDGTEKELLDFEGVANADAFVSLTDIDEENLLMSMYAAHRGVPKVIAKINRLGYADVIKKAGIDRVLSPKHITANRIVQYVRHMANQQDSIIKTLYRIDGQAEVVEFVATDSTLHLGVPLSELPLKKNMLITAIVRDGTLIIPRGGHKLQAGDTVIVITLLKQLSNLNDIFRG